MKGLRLNVDGETRIFRPTGEVAVVIDGEPVVKGAWRSQSLSGEPKDNQIRYDIAGTDQEPVPIRYSFNPFNQLQAVIPAEANGGSDSAPFAFIGKIVIDDKHDITYNLLTSEGQLMTRSVIVYGDLRFNASGSSLLIDLTDGGTAEIKGQSGISSIEAKRNNIEEFRGDDLLAFHAVTRNDLESQPVRVPIAADIQLTGSWDIQQGQLVFVSQVKGDLSKPDVIIGLAGRVKGITAGLAYMVGDGEAARIAFQIRGQHTWDAANASWSLSLGYSEKQFSATFKGRFNHQTAEGNKLAITGTTTVQGGDGSALQMDLDVTVSYSWKNGQLVFTADVSGDNQSLSYDLKLEGTFQFKNGTLTFQVKYSNAAPDSSFQLQLGFTGNEASLVQSLSLVLGVDKDKVSLDFQFEMRMTWKDGVRVKSEPQPIAA